MTAETPAPTGSSVKRQQSAVSARARVYLLGGWRNEESNGFVSLVVMFVEGAPAEQWHQSEGAEQPFAIIGALT